MRAISFGYIIAFSLLWSGLVLPEAHAHPPVKSPLAKARLDIPAMTGVPVIDGHLSEPLYARPPLASKFVVASDVTAEAAKTRMWLFWADVGLYWAADVVDVDIVAEQVADELTIGRQDRVEVFLWSGEPSNRYIAFEVNPHGQVLDYQVKFHRQMEFGWHAKNARFAGQLTPTGYSVEGFVPADSLAEAGLKLGPGERWRGGLFRGDYHPDSKHVVTWITWLDPGLPEPDFHVRGAFGEWTLAPAGEPPQ